MEIWTEKYRPASFSEIKGQENAVSKLKSFLTKFDLEKASKKISVKKAIVLYGPPGTGKTSLAYISARETNSEIFELNASDLRNKEKLNEILKPAIEQKSLVKKNKIILVDEADGMTGTDRGGVQELVHLIDKTEHP